MKTYFLLNLSGTILSTLGMVIMGAGFALAVFCLIGAAKVFGSSVHLAPELAAIVSNWVEYSIAMIVGGASAAVIGAAAHAIRDSAQHLQRIARDVRQSA